MQETAAKTILREILALGGVARHKELHDRVGGMAMSRATFHNKLHLLVEAGYLTRYRGSVQRPGSYYRIPDAIMIILRSPDMEALHLVCEGLKRSLRDSSPVGEGRREVLRVCLSDLEKIVPRIFLDIFDASLRTRQNGGKMDPFSYFHHLILADYFSNLLSVLAESKDLSIEAIRSTLKVRADREINRATKEILS
ncbi:MAG: hypothetical protein HYU02_02150 [Thaumarchaeota archaeon]|nr:hypothetical protein [Nitrososphaerota archaeon]